MRWRRHGSYRWTETFAVALRFGECGGAGLARGCTCAQDVETVVGRAGSCDTRLQGECSRDLKWAIRILLNIG